MPMPSSSFLKSNVCKLYRVGICKNFNLQVYTKYGIYENLQAETYTR